MKEIIVPIKKYKDKYEGNIFNSKSSCLFFEETYKERKFKVDENIIKNEKLNYKNWEHFKYEFLQKYVVARYNYKIMIDKPLHRSFFNDINGVKKLKQFIMSTIYNTEYITGVSQTLNKHGENIHEYAYLDIYNKLTLNSYNGFTKLKEFMVNNRDSSITVCNKFYNTIFSDWEEGFTLNYEAPYIANDTWRVYGGVFTPSNRSFLEFLEFLNSANLIKIYKKELLDFAEKYDYKKSINFLNNI